MSRVTSLLNLVKHPFILCTVFSLICSPCYASPNKVSDESLIVKYIVEEGTKDKLKQNSAHMKEISSFTYGKALEFAKQKKEFSEELYGEYGEGVQLESKYKDLEDSVDIIKLDEDNYLINKALDTPHDFAKSCLFLINSSRPDWTPLQLNSRSGDQVAKWYSFLPNWTTYTAPLLISIRWFQWEAGHTEDMYVFKEGAFKLILSEETAVDEKRAEDVNLNDENTDIEEHLKTTIHYIAHDITQLYAKFAPKGGGGLEKRDNWEKIFFVKPSKAYFHKQPNDKTKQASYIVRGDAVYISETKEAWALAHYLDPNNNKATTGWLKKDDLISLWEPSADHVCAR